MWRNRTIANGPADERVRDRSLLGDAVGSPSLDLNFAGGTLDPRIDFQRTTVGTYYRGQFNQNLVRQSQAFDDTTFWGNTVAGTGVAPVRTANNAVAPDGTMTADTITFDVGAGTTSSDFSLITQTIAGFITGIGYMGSVWMRGTVGGEQILFRQASNSYTLATLTTSWQRVTFYVASSTVNTFQLGVRQGIIGTINSTATVEIWGAQQTEGSLLTPYIPTTTAAITQGQIASSQPWNLLQRSQEFDVSPWASAVTGAGVSPVITANAAVAPDGTTTADQIDFNCGGLTLSDRCIRRQATSLSATTYTVSVWARSATGTTQHIQFHQDGGTSTTTFAIGTSWQRLTWTYTSVGGSVQTGLELRGNNTAGVTTSSIYVWGMQLNEGSSALDYRSTTSSALWLPRFENDPVTGEARGLLIEGGATNLCLQSAAVRTSPWVTNGLTTAGASITAPDGTASGVECVAVNGVGSATAYSYQQITATASTAYTTSFFLKAKGTALNTIVRMQARASTTVLSNLDVTFNNATGTVGSVTSGTWTATSATSTPIGNGWYRVTLTGTTPATTNNLWAAFFFDATGNGTDGVYAWGAQVEAQSFASSYIPTTTATVARGADNAVMTGTNFSSWYNQSEGTVLAKWRQWNVGGNEFAIAARFALASGIANSIWIAKQNTASVGRRIEFEMRDASGTQRVVSVANPVTDPVITAAGAQKFGDTFGMSYNGVATVSTAQTRTPAPDRLFVGSYDLTAGHINSTISRLAYWPTRLPDATLQSLTT